MRIGILTLAAGRRAGGPETYEIEFIRALTQIDRRNEYFIYCTGQYAADALEIQQDNFTLRVLKPAFRPISLTFTLPVWLKRDGIDLLHATYASPPLVPKNMVMTMHGMVNFLHPEFFPKSQLWRLNALMKIGLKKARLVLCVSDHVRQQVAELLKIPCQRLVVSHLGVGRQFAPMPRAQAKALAAERHGLTDPYILYVGKCHPAKNLERLIRAYAEFRDRYRSEVRLVMVGSRAGQTAEAGLIAELGLSESVIRIPYLPPADLPVLYSAADAFVFPSLFESFGLPVVEAMACGTPVVTSNVACLPEITDGAAVLVNPHSVTDIADGIGRVQSSRTLRETLVSRGLERARCFTWENCARSTVAAYAGLEANG
ncbi:MAG: glycosyltransferase family 4 protein [Bryobacteraceae bacterium]